MFVLRKVIYKPSEQPSFYCPSVLRTEMLFCLLGPLYKHWNRFPIALYDYQTLARMPFNKQHCWLCSTTLTNIKSNASGDKRPGATLTKLTQLSYGSSLGFGEAKVAQATTNNNDLRHDLLRLGIFCKEAINTHHWNACLAFQIHRFTIVFYLMRLHHDGI
ncbi:hypothetical protein BDC45DRAFT_539909 [Circinella umbellata]|nr:hypothetical protein BDC45DRAFT_539909 [Circinella umbellata]